MTSFSSYFSKIGAALVRRLYYCHAKILNYAAEDKVGDLTGTPAEAINMKLHRLTQQQKEPAP